MNNLKVFLSIVILVIIPQKATPSFDYFKLALQWPPTVNPGGKIPQPMNFTIHGVWSHSFTSSSYCPLPKNRYVSITDPILVARLGVSWPNLLGPNDDFWRYEWTKHGGCSEASYDQTQYFMLGVQLKDRYDVYKLLNSNSLIDGIDYPLSLIESAIRSETHKQAEYSCASNNLKEVRICFDPNLDTIDCPQISRSNCPVFQVAIPPP